ncbi:meiotically up-regulated gene family-domain-containing protein [Aspergillus floccosus]
MQSALGLAEAGSDALNQLSQPGDGPTAVAQRDLFSYLFAEAMKNGHIDTSNKEWQHFTSGFSAVLNYKKTPDGSPEQNDGMYGFLHMDDLIVYCDYSRFQENKDCQGNTAPGKACDTSINVEPHGDVHGLILFAADKPDTSVSSGENIHETIHELKSRFCISVSFSAPDHTTRARTALSLRRRHYRSVAKDCATYTTYPGSITPITSNPFLTPPIPSPFTTSQAGGEIDVYPSQSVDIFQIVGGLRVTQTVGVGPASTIIPPAPTEISGNNKGSGICQSTGDACDRAYHQFDDDRLYTSYAAYAAEVDTMVLQGLTFGKGRCIAQFECEDYGAGMTGKQIKDAVEHLKEAHDAGKCGNTYLSNTCHITLNYCTDCDVRN